MRSSNLASAPTTEGSVRIELIQNVQDFAQSFDVASQAFGVQTGDEIWTGLNPGWDTPEGKREGTSRLANSFLVTKTNKDGKPNTMYLKATVSDPQQAGGGVVVGFAIWQQFSVVEGHGDPPVSDEQRYQNIQELYPDNEPERRFHYQALSSLHKLRDEIIRDKAYAQPPAVLQLDLCVVDPAYQRSGIAGKLVQFGLDEAERRGGLECVTQASSMGRGVYLRLGFKADDEDIAYEFDEEFKGRKTPPNVLMRTG